MSSNDTSSGQDDPYCYFEVEGAVFREPKEGHRLMEIFVNAERTWAPYKGDSFKIRHSSHTLSLEDVLPYMEPRVARQAAAPDTSTRKTARDKPTNIFPLQHRKFSAESISTLESLLEEAKRGEICGLALVVLRSNNSYDLKLRGEAAQAGNQMSIAGMLAALQKMALELDG